MKVFVVGPWMGAAVEELFTDWGWSTTRKLKECDLIQFTGGSDISPDLYGKQWHRATSCNIERDKYELLVFNEGVRLRKPFAGICRGAQLLNVLSGGSMWQHVNNHGSTSHDLKDEMTGEVFSCNSIHHQMMIPSDDAVVLAYAKEATVKEDVDDEGMVKTTYYVSKDFNPGDPEIVMYWPDKLPALCFQGHPEWESEDLQKRYMHYIDDYCFDGKQMAKGFK